jgi:hypothetical protein
MATRVQSAGRRRISASHEFGGTMKKVLVGAVLLLVTLVNPVFAQQSATEAEIRRAVPYSRMLREFPDLTITEYNDVVRELAAQEARKRPAPLSQPHQYQQPRPLYRAPSYELPSLTPPPTYTAPPLPSSRTTYDWRSGNTYTTRKGFNGDTEVSGFNANTGSTWNTTIKPDGSMNGYDSKMNPWSYDATTGTYINYGTGKMCFGEGAARVCS